MQVRVVGAGVVVVEGCGDRTGDLDLRDRALRSLDTDPGGEDLAFEEVESVDHGGVVGFGDQRLRTPSATPQRARWPTSGWRR